MSFLTKVRVRYEVKAKQEDNTVALMKKYGVTGGASEEYRRARALYNHYTSVQVDLNDLLNSVGSPNREVTYQEKAQSKHLCKLLEKIRKEFMDYLDTL